MDTCSIGVAELRRAALAVCLLSLTAAVARAEPSSGWGVSPSAALSYNPKEWATRMADAGIGWVRGFRNGSELEGVQPMREAGMSICGILMWSPTKPQRFPVSDLAGFRQYVIDRVKKYRGVVAHWEVWNEPPNFTEDKSPASYAKVIAAAYDAAKSVDPNVKIGIASKSIHLQFMADSIRAGAQDKFDFVTLHPYEMAGMLPQGWEGPYLGIVASVRAMLKDVNPAKADVPIWFTEVGLAVNEAEPSAVTEIAQADGLIKLFTMGFAQGVTRIHWFDPRDSEGLTLGLLRRDGSSKPAHRALTQLSGALGARPKFLGYVTFAKNTFGFLFEGLKRDVVVAWAKPEQCRMLSFDEPVTVLYPEGAKNDDCRNISVDTRPIIVAAARDSAVAKSWRAASLKTRPSWDTGTEPKSVALHAGQGPLGVHIVGPVTQRCSNGRCEYDLSTRNSVRFAIDPLFQGYQSQALEVVLTLQPHAGNMAGFNLKYESRGANLDEHGMRRAGGWTSVRGTRPVVLRYKIVDPSFVGKYGANLAVDCDSVRYCDFGILSVIINKR
jgi:hypothetical protein